MAGQKGRGRRRPARPRRFEAIAAGAAIALLALLFLPWYDATYSGGRQIPYGGLGRTAWDTLDLIAPLLALISVLALGLALARALWPGWKPAIVPGAAIAVLGALATVLVLVRVIFPPGLDGLVGVEFEVSPDLAAFLGLAASLALALAGYRAMRAEGSSFAAVADSLQPPRERPASRRR